MSNPSRPAVGSSPIAQRCGRWREAQWRPCRIETPALEAIDGWVGRYRKLWDKNFDQMDAYLAQLQKGNPDGPKQ